MPNDTFDCSHRLAIQHNTRTTKLCSYGTYKKNHTVVNHTISGLKPYCGNNLVPPQIGIKYSTKYLTMFTLTYNNVSWNNAGGFDFILRFSDGATFKQNMSIVVAGISLLLLTFYCQGLGMGLTPSIFLPDLWSALFSYNIPIIFDPSNFNIFIMFGWTTFNTGWFKKHKFVPE